MTIETSVPRRRRRTPDALRQDAIAAARRILAEEGPAAVTLQRVAGELGMAHGNITHHFGSAANLQATLADTLLADLDEAVRHGAESLDAGDIRECDLVDLICDVFEESGVGRLIGWLAAQRSPHLAPLYERFGRLPAELAANPTERAIFTEEDLPAVIASVVIPALGASLIGAELFRALNLPPTFARQRIAADLKARRDALKAVAAGRDPHSSEPAKTVCPRGPGG